MYNPIWFVSAAAATATAVFLLFYFFSFVYFVFAILPFSTLCILFVLDLLNISQTKKFAAHFISAKIQKIVSFMFSLCTFQSVVQITWKCRCLIMESSKYLLNFFFHSIQIEWICPDTVHLSLILRLSSALCYLVNTLWD